MAKDNSFDIVSEVDLAEVDNAVNQAMKDLRRMRNAALVMEHAVLRLQRLSRIVD